MNSGPCDEPDMWLTGIELGCGRNVESFIFGLEKTYDAVTRDL